MASAPVSSNPEFRAFRDEWHKWVPLAAGALNRAVEQEFEGTEFRFTEIFGRRALFGDVIALVAKLNSTLSDEEIRVIGAVLSALDPPTYDDALPPSPPTEIADISRRSPKAIRRQRESLKHELREHGKALFNPSKTERGCQSLPFLLQYDQRAGTTIAADYIAFFRTFAEWLTQAQDTIDVRKRVALRDVEKWLVESGGPASRRAKPDLSDSEEIAAANKRRPKVPQPPPPSLAELLASLQSLVGLSNVKKEIEDLVAFLKLQEIRMKRGMPVAKISRHIVFCGNPGTGKTTVARLLSQIYSRLGFLTSGHLVETDRAGLVAGFVGQTALKTRAVCEEALGGLLFVDEAYALLGQANDFGREAVDTLLKFMEDNREDLVVVVAGYPSPMTEFLESNPGLQSRFTRHIVFPDYSPEELSCIFGRFCNDAGLTATPDAAAYAKELFESAFEKRDDTFGNARLVRNMFEQCLVRQARRLIHLDPLTDDMIKTIEAADLVG
jgi:hypothetical protein